MSCYVILSEKKWHIDLFQNLQKRFFDSNWILIKNKKDFNFNNLNSISPTKIFIPHWSYLIPSEIYNNFECIVFHMTDLPYGRGGSPLQNLIVKGHETTKITAIKVSKGIDTGDYYIKRDLSLSGTAQEIFIRSNSIIEEMINEIITKDLIPKAQVGEEVKFKRRRPEESDISDLTSLKMIYDYIRMLDADDYPNAFLETPFFKFEFYKSSFDTKSNSVLSNVRITKK